MKQKLNSTNNDFEELKVWFEKKFPTKEELLEYKQKTSKEIEILEKVIHLHVLSSALDTKQELKKDLSRFKDELFTKIDPLLAEIENAREDRVIGTNKIQLLQKEIETMKQKMQQIEKSLQAS